MSATALSLIFAGLSVTTAAIFHLIGLFNAEKARCLTLETRQAEFMNAIYDHVIADDYWSGFEAIVNQWQWTDYEDFMAKYGPSNPPMWRLLWRVCARWEHLGLLVRDEIITPALAWHWIGAFPIGLWTKLEPIIVEYRARVEPEPKGMVFEWFEDLVATLRDERMRDRRHFVERQRARDAKRARAAAHGS